MASSLAVISRALSLPDERISIYLTLQIVALEIRICSWSMKPEELDMLLRFRAQFGISSSLLYRQRACETGRLKMDTRLAEPLLRTTTFGLAELRCNRCQVLSPNLYTVVWLERGSLDIEWGHLSHRTALCGGSVLEANRNYSRISMRSKASSSIAACLRPVAPPRSITWRKYARSDPPPRNTTPTPPLAAA